MTTADPKVLMTDIDAVEPLHFRSLTRVPVEGSSMRVTHGSETLTQAGIIADELQDETIADEMIADETIVDETIAKVEYLATEPLVINFSQQSLISTCRDCCHYQYEGRRGGHCQRLNVSVQSIWCACPLAIGAFQLFSSAQDIVSADVAATSQSL